MDATTATIDIQTTTLIEEDIYHLLTLMDFNETKVTCNYDKEGTLCISIDAGDNGRTLIGTSGQHLNALQHIVRCILRQRLADSPRVTVDVNNYRVRREQSLLNIAEATALKAQHTGRSITLDAMSAADRRTIHTALTNRKDIQTESLGIEPNRRVVVKPVFL